MKTKFILLFSFFSFFAAFDAMAQNMKIEDVLKVSVKQSGTIETNGVVEGYYVFYSSGRAKKGMLKYTLRILDPELNKVIDKNMEMDQRTIVLNAATNGSSLAFRFWDARNRELIAKGFDFKGKSLFTKKTEVKNNMAISMLTSPGGNSELGFVPIPDFGYLHIYPTKEDKLTYVMKLISDDKAVKGGTIKGNPKKVEMASNICVANDMVINLVMSRDKLLNAKDMDMQLQGINVKTGKETFNTSLKSLKYNTMIINGHPAPDGENIILYGLNYKPDDKISKKPKGMIKFLMNPKGEVLDSWTFDWKGKSIKLDDGEEAGNLYVHDFITGKNGHTYMVAEQINLAVGASIAGALLTRGGSTSFKIDDMMILELDQDFKLVDVEVIEKSRNTFTFPGIPIGGIFAIGMLADAYGQFDYSYYQMIDDDFQVTYIDYERAKGKKNGFVFGGVTNVDGKYNYDKIDISNKGVETRVLKGKPGYVLLMDYIKREKELNLRLEKINF